MLTEQIGSPAGRGPSVAAGESQSGDARDDQRDTGEAECCCRLAQVHDAHERRAGGADAGPDGVTSANRKLAERKRKKDDAGNAGANGQQC